MTEDLTIKQLQVQGSSASGDETPNQAASTSTNAFGVLQVLRIADTVSCQIAGHGYVAPDLT